MNITLTNEEIAAITGYEKPCKQLGVLKSRGFYRSYISRKGGVVLERAHYEAVVRGEDSPGTTKTANLAFMRRAA